MSSPESSGDVLQVLRQTVSVVREQVRREAGDVIEWQRGPAKRTAEACLALLAELEQAERERDGFATEVLELHTRLARVPALVEALKEVKDMDPNVIQIVDGGLHKRISDALTAWEVR